MSLKYFNFSSDRIYKRVAFLNGNCGVSDRLTITGQIVDVPITEHQRSQKWNYTHSLPENIIRSIRPFMDIGISSIKNPYLKMEILQADSIELSENAEVVYSSIPFYGDDIGFFRENIKKSLNPGNYISKIYSLKQSEESDEADSSDECTVIGYGKLTVLPSEYSDYIITSDIDQTFLDTPLNSIPGLIETLFETPRFRVPIPGMPAYYRALQTAGGHPLYFISASPHFYRRTLSSLFAMHGIDPSGLYLKSFSGTMDGIVKKIISSLINLDKILEGGVKHAFDRSVKYLGSSMYNLVDQVAYKLVALLEHRLTQPTGAKEILIGDDIDSDYFIFTLYQFLLLSEISGENLTNYLYELKFQDRSAFTSDSADRVAELLEKNRKIHGNINSVSAVWINSAGDEPKEELMKNTMAKLPGDISTEKNLNPFRIYENTFELALISIDSGALNPENIREIWKELEGKTVKGIQYNHAYAEKTINSFPFQNADKKELISSIKNN
ncbi:MAG: hypothetical protein OEZ34_08800 [Spirochaetia bacterium]|nr:hypothetical protein [Spirochaetia bacterium]